MSPLRSQPEISTPNNSVEKSPENPLDSLGNMLNVLKEQATHPEVQQLIAEIETKLAVMNPTALQEIESTVKKMLTPFTDRTHIGESDIIAALND